MTRMSSLAMIRVVESYHLHEKFVKTLQLCFFLLILAFSFSRNFWYLCLFFFLNKIKHVMTSLSTKTDDGVFNVKIKYSKVF